MKTKFNDFINESKAKDKYTFDEFLDHVKDSLMNDFSDTQLQAETFIEQYFDLLKKFYNNGFDVKEAIAATKRPGIKIDDSNIDESFVLSIDDDIDNLNNLILNSKSKKDLFEVKEAIEQYFNKYSEKSFSDVRIFERIKNNYKKVIDLYEKKLNNQ